MNLEDLTPGIYRLTRDVPAPLKDKRIKHEWRYLPCEKGMTFLVQDDPTHGLREICAVRGYYHQSFSVKDSAALELISALERVEHPSAVQHLKMRWRESSAGAVLNTLVEQKRITLEDIDAILELHDKEDGT